MKENNALEHFVVYLLSIVVNLFNSPTKLKQSWNVPEEKIHTSKTMVLKLQIKCACIKK
jgi:hypothetical protein